MPEFQLSHNCLILAAILADGSFYIFYDFVMRQEYCMWARFARILVFIVKESLI